MHPPDGDGKTSQVEHEAGFSCGTFGQVHWLSKEWKAAYSGAYHVALHRNPLWTNAVNIIFEFLWFRYIWRNEIQWPVTKRSIYSVAHSTSYHIPRKSQYELDLEFGVVIPPVGMKHTSLTPARRLNLAQWLMPRV